MATLVSINITQKMGDLCHVENIPYKAWDLGAEKKKKR
jgi:hypothetical protein